MSIKGKLSGLLVLLLVLAATSSVQADDCAKAKAVYSSGAKLLELNERVAAFQEAVNLCPSYAEAHVNLADAYEKLSATSSGDVDRFNRLLDKAASEYSLALKHKRGLFPAYLGLGDTYRVMGLYERAEEAYNNALQVKPADPRALLGLNKIKAIMAHNARGLTSSEKIVEHFRRSSGGTEFGDLMGFADRTVVKDRLTFDNILFDPWSSELTRKEAIEQLQQIGKAISVPEFGDARFVVEGHTDDRGDSERNLRLSLERAEAVKNYLTENFKMDPRRIKTQGFGYSRPRAPNDSPEHMLENRRVEILFLERGATD